MPLTVDNPHRSALNTGNFALNGNALVDTVFAEIGRYTIPQGVGLALGYGAQQSQDTATGRAYMVIQSSVPAAIPGKVRIVIHDTQDREVGTLMEARTETLSQSAVTDRLPLPGGGTVLTQGYSFVVLMKPDAAGTPDAAECTILLDMTEYDAHF